MKEECLTCGELIDDPWKDCEPCLGANPVFSMLHKFNARDLVPGKFVNKSDLVNLRMEYPFYPYRGSFER